MTGQSGEAIEGIFANLPRPLWLLTAADGERQGGLVATWVMQASLDAKPCIVLVSLAENHFTRVLVDGGRAFGLHLISERHLSLAEEFATKSGRDVDKFADVSWSKGSTGVPRIHDVVAWMDCSVVARLATGDRVLYWAEVVDGERCSDERPLTDAVWLAQLDDSQREMLKDERERDNELLRPKFDAWRDDLPELLRCPTK